MGDCAGIIACFHEECSKRGICGLTLEYSAVIYAPKTAEVAAVKKQSRYKLGDKKTGKHKCERKFKRWCLILGQCIYDHPLIINDDKAAGELRNSKKASESFKVLERLMPSLRRFDRKYKPDNIKKKGG